MENLVHIILPGLALCFMLQVLMSGTAASQEVNFVARLANFQGIVPTLWSKIAVDKERGEIFTLNPRQWDLRIFNQNGMEIFIIGDDVELAGATDLDLGEDGNIYLAFPRGDEHKIMKLDYKGEPLEFITLKNFPSDFHPFKPHGLQYVNGKLYLADFEAMNVVITDTDGAFEQGFNLREALLAIEEELQDQPGGEALSDPEQFAFVELFGFCAGPDGSVYFTLPTLFSAFKYDTEGELKGFGSPGSGPGKFGVVSGVAVDRKGNIYITDRLRSVVMIFNEDFEFLKEFGYRGLRDDNLLVPDDIAVDDEAGLIFVAQAANRGVNVYRITDY